jgi:hypothetical protein
MDRDIDQVSESIRQRSFDVLDKFRGMGMEFGL